MAPGTLGVSTNVGRSAKRNNVIVHDEVQIHLQIDELPRTQNPKKQASLFTFSNSQTFLKRLYLHFKNLLAHTIASLL